MTFDNTAILSGTSIAATSWVLDGSTHLRVYTQDKDNVIRETRFDGNSWSGGTGTSPDLLVEAKPNTGIAALTHYVGSSSLKLRVYYISNDGFVREIAQDNGGKWYSGDLDHQLKLEAAPQSRLAVIGQTWDGKKISVYYQKPDGAIAEVSWTTSNTWVEGDIVVPKAPLGTGLAATTFNTKTGTGIRVYYQDDTGALHEKCLNKGGQGFVTGHLPNITDVAKVTNISAYSHGSDDKPNLEVQYLNTRKVLSEYRYYDDAWYGVNRPDNVTALSSSGIALIQVKDHLSLRSYIQIEENRIQELCWESGFVDWQKGAILPPQNA